MRRRDWPLWRLVLDLAPTPWGWQRVWACDYDYGYDGYY
jgi:hypothetical protein